jgi:hypothetical protein
MTLLFLAAFKTREPPLAGLGDSRQGCDILAIPLGRLYQTLPFWRRCSRPAA